MKKLCILLFFLSCLVLHNSCQDWEELNTDPDQAQQVPPNLLLPAVQANWAYALGGDLSRITASLINHIYPSTRSFSPGFVPHGADNVWEFAIYGGTLLDLKNIIEETQGTSPHYEGIAQIMTAMILATTTNLFGDIPYSEALQGAANRKPKFDTQESIYQNIEQLLLTGIENIQQESSILSPMDDDLVYQGDLNKWEKFANALRARYAITLSEIDANAAQKALTILTENGLQDNQDNALVHFGTTEESANPWYQYIEQRDDFGYNGELYRMLNDDDPRKWTYFNHTNFGSDYSSITLGDVFAAIDAPISFMTYEEQKFIEAEAAFRTNDLERSATAYNEAIHSSIANIETEYNKAIAILHPDLQADSLAIMANDNILTFLDKMAIETAQSINLDKILTQKYITSFTKSECWTDWRRTSIPELPYSYSFINNFHRLPYPELEVMFNSENVPNVTTQDKVWWDQ